MHLLRQVICNRRAATHVGKYVRGFVSTTNVRPSAEALTVPAPDGSETPANPKLLKIVNDIAALNLLEVSELSSLLKKTLNLPDAPAVAYGAGAPAAAAPAAEEEEEAGPAVIQTLFKVKLNSFDESKKIVLIKELKNQCEGMNLVQAKKFIESAPAFVKEDLSKDEAEALKVALEKFGAVVEVV
ncbi:50S ribosomal protein L7/L12 [Sitodiplosis mosellana]|uniref:50S ribosomal protein L7/L12 n=1 Tax=Sitodiplosis mosellana TaxID=263140 RepID=UPI0024451242|nr:50S ribosomal protein L7/L12 [Sitodiplosis mosellana]